MSAEGAGREPADLLTAETVCAGLAKDLEILFQLHGNEWAREQAEKHFKDREALARVRTLLLDEAEAFRV